MTSPYAFLPQVPIPAHWTGEQALIVVELLDALTSAIWAAHGDDIEHTLGCRTPTTQPKPADLSDLSDLPF